MTARLSNTRRQKILVGGPIQYALNRRGMFDGKLASTFRLILSEIEGAGYEILSAHRAESFGQADLSHKPARVASRDFNWVKECDAFVAVLPGRRGSPLRSDGTCVELGWSTALGKPTIIACTPGMPYSPVVRGLKSIANVVEVDLEKVMLNPAILVKLLSRRLRAS